MQTTCSANDPSLLNSPAEKSKAKKSTTKAERRALQEAQRATKAAKRTDSSNPVAQSRKSSVCPAIPVVCSKLTVVRQTTPVHLAVSTSLGANSSKVSCAIADRQQEEPPACLHTDIFRQWPIFKFVTIHAQSKHDRDDQQCRSIDASFLSLGEVMCKQSMETSENECCVLLLHALERFICEFPSNPDGDDYCRALIKSLTSNASYLDKCSTNSTMMRSIMKYIEAMAVEMINVDDESKVRNDLLSTVVQFREERILAASRDMIARLVDRETNLIRAGDRILLVCNCMNGKLARQLKILKDSEANVKLVICHTNGPCQDATGNWASLHEFEATHISIQSLQPMMQSVDKMIIWADLMFSNGGAMVTPGATLIAMEMDRKQKPVVVCCETYKFQETNAATSLDFNQMIDKKNTCSRLKDHAANANFQYAGLIYDLLPGEYISHLVSEKGTMPPSSVAAIAKLQYGDYPIMVN